MLPFGGNRGGTAFNDTTTKRFTGQYHEATLPGGEGLSYYGSRWYNAKLGRFLSADTVVPGPGNPQVFNRYSYVKNRPLVAIDPTGHVPTFSQGTGSQGARASLAITVLSWLFSQIKQPSAPTRPTPIFTELMFSVPRGNYRPAFAPYSAQNAIQMNHFGATNFAQTNASNFYEATSGLHGGVDFMLLNGTAIYSRTNGSVVGINSGDADPNVVVRHGSGENAYDIVYGHVVADAQLKLGDEVKPDTLIGSVWENPNGDHLHLTIRQNNAGVITVYNPLYFFPPTTFDYDAHITEQSGVGELITNQAIFSFNYSYNSFWAGDDVGAVNSDGDRVYPPE